MLTWGKAETLTRFAFGGMGGRAPMLGVECDLRDPCDPLGRTPCHEELALTTCVLGRSTFVKVQDQPPGMILLALNEQNTEVRPIQQGVQRAG